MRKVFVVTLMLASVPAVCEAAPAGAVATPPSQGQTIAERHARRLDRLFAELKREGDDAKAKTVADQIWTEWRRSGSATIDLLMQWADDAVRKQDYSAALDFLDQVTVLQPDFAEGWDRRATVHFLMHNYAKSMADIEKTLALEPRHFGALSGMGAIFKAVGKKKQALSAYERVLAIYPAMRSAQKQVIDLTDDLAGDPI